MLYGWLCSITYLVRYSKSHGQALTSAVDHKFKICNIMLKYLEILILKTEDHR